MSFSPLLQGGGLLSAAPPVVDEAASTGAVFTTINVGGIDYRLATFLSSGTLAVTTGGNFEYLLMAGGGAGAGPNSFSPGAGGGAGGRQAGTANLTAIAHTITVGAGGASVPEFSSGSDGADSAIVGVITATGGGGGGVLLANGRAGGSGGGSGGRNGTTTTGGAGTPGQGFDGGTGDSDLFNGQGSGGGGAGAAGVGATGGAATPPYIAGPGGAGESSSISGTPTLYGGGGGSGGDTPGAGGSGIGGTGGGFNQDGLAGAANTGSGGGGAGAGANRVSGAGGSGIVRVRWLFVPPTGWTDIPGATSTSYTTPPTTALDNGARYRVIATNSAGETISAEALLTVVSGRRRIIIIS